MRHPAEYHQRGVRRCILLNIKREIRDASDAIVWKRRVRSRAPLQPTIKRPPASSSFAARAPPAQSCVNLRCRSRGISCQTRGAHSELHATTSKMESRSSLPLTLTAAVSLILSPWPRPFPRPSLLLLRRPPKGLLDLQWPLLLLLCKLLLRRGVAGAAVQGASADARGSAATAVRGVLGQCPCCCPRGTGGCCQLDAAVLGPCCCCCQGTRPCCCDQRHKSNMTHCMGRHVAIA